MSYLFFQLGKEKVAKFLIENGADIFAIDENKTSALHLAALSGMKISHENLKQIGFPIILFFQAIDSFS